MLDEFPVISVSGTPASGKTYVCSLLGGLIDAVVVDLGEYARKNRLDSGWDTGRETLIVDAELVWDKLVSDDNLSGPLILDGHFSHLMPASHCLILRCSPLVLLKRYGERGYPESKMRENLEAEYLGVISDEAAGFRNLLEVDATDGIQLDEISGWVKTGGSYRLDLDWSFEFMRCLEKLG